MNKTTSSLLIGAIVAGLAGGTFVSTNVFAKEAKTAKGKAKAGKDKHKGHKGHEAETPNPADGQNPEGEVPPTTGTGDGQ